MKKNTFLLILFFLSIHSFVFAQVGVGTVTPASSLDIVASNQAAPASDDGILIPRVDAFAAINPAAAQDSMVVYLTTIDGTDIPGFYYWNNATTTWLPFTGCANCWSTVGNSGTTPGTGAGQNFMGTTDGQDVLFARNLDDRMRIMASYIGFESEIQTRVTGPNTGDVLTRLYANADDGIIDIYQNNAVTHRIHGNGETVFNELGSATSDFRLESDALPNMFLLDASDNQISINTAGPFAGVLFSAYTPTAGWDAIAASTTSSGDGIYTQTTSSGEALRAIASSSGQAIYADCNGCTTSTIIAVTDRNGGTVIDADNDTFTGANSSGDTGVFNSDNNAGFGGVWATNGATTNGTGYGVAACSYGVAGGVFGDDRYEFGVMGQSGSGRRSGGLYGGSNTLSTGFIGYRDSGGTYHGGYFDSTYNHTNGAGRSSSQDNIASGIGIGSIGDLLGGWLKAEIYGTITSGNRFGLYVQGKTFTNDAIIQLVKDKNNKVIPTYTSTSESNDITSRGTSSLSNGTQRITFSENYKNIISDNITITITSIGESNGIHLVTVDNNGFTVKENNNGKSNVNFNWIAIAEKNNKIDLPKEVLLSEFDDRLNGIMFDENNTKDSSEAMYWDGSRMIFNELPENLQPTSKHSLKERKKRNLERKDYSERLNHKINP